MTAAMASVDTAAGAKKIDPARSPVDGVDAELVARLVAQARAAGVQLTGFRRGQVQAQRHRHDHAGNACGGQISAGQRSPTPFWNPQACG